MKRSVRFLLAWVLTLALTVSTLALPRPQEGPGGSVPSTGSVLVLQGGSTWGLLDGRMTATTGSRYAQNGVQLVPLAQTATALGGTVTDDGGAVTVQYRNRFLTFTEGSWSAQSEGEPVALSSTPVTVDGVFHVPAVSLAHLGWTVHTTGYYDGDLVLLSRTALPEDRLEAALSSALEILGPNAGLFPSSSVLLRLDSRWSVQNGKTTAMSETTDAVTPTRSGSTILVPLAVCAPALGYTVTPSGGGYLVTGRGTSLTFSQAMVSTADVTSKLGGHVYLDDATGAIVISAYSLDAKPSLRSTALEQAGQLTLLDSELAKGYIALTFDDGPSGSITSTLLDGLKARNAHATFFLCNYRISTFPQTMDRYLAEGHEIANHSATHANLSTASSSKLAQEIDTTNSTITQRTGVTPTLMRPPGGAYDSDVLAALKSRGMSCILWSLDPLDWKLRNTEKIVQAVVSQVEDGDIVLLHDMSNASVQAALQIIDIMQAKGYRFVTVSELAEIKGVTLQPGQVYHGFTD